MDTKLQLIIHGRGNAWPVFLGETHPFYNRHDPRELSSASFSLLVTSGNSATGEVLVDAGHGTVQSMIAGRNRIPDCICLTHGHLDHTLGVEWVVQSFNRSGNREKRYPVYASGPVLSALVAAYPQLEELITERQLVPASAVRTEGFGDFSVTAFPVYHGAGAYGASMLLFVVAGKRLLFTGDLICPLLRQQDYDTIMEPDLLVVDTNNRFPWPRSNHWSFAGGKGDHGERNEILSHYQEGLSWETVSAPHCLGDAGRKATGYFGDLKSEWDTAYHSFTIIELVKRIRPRQVIPVHYSGAEDEKHYGEPRLSVNELGEWIEKTAMETGLESRFMIPSDGQVIDLF